MAFKDHALISGARRVIWASQLVLDPSNELLNFLVLHGFNLLYLEFIETREKAIDQILIFFSNSQPLPLQGRSIKCLIDFLTQLLKILPFEIEDDELL